MAILALLLTTATGTVKADTQSNLEITNKSGVIFDFTHEQLMAMPRTTEYAELYCYGSLVLYGNWTGVLLSFTTNTDNPEVSSIQVAASMDTCSIPLICFSHRRIAQK
jgi:DMSO/TMAO reductase YedYZ molybdopterin-dependent catalytic subunit